MSVRTPIREETTDWHTVFPDFTSIQGSCAFIKKLIAVSLSTFTYMRRIFPKEAYGEIDVKSMKIKLLVDTGKITSVTKFIQLIRNCYDAVEKKYLKQMNVGICLNQENRDEVIEAFNLVFSYKDDEYSITCNNQTAMFSQDKDNSVQIATFLMLKNINAMTEHLNPLPRKAYLTMKLLYDDDVTPPDYDPPGFEPCMIENFNFPRKYTKYILGKVDTDIHKFRVVLKSTLCHNETGQMHAFIEGETSSQPKSSDSEGQPLSQNSLNEDAKKVSTISDKEKINCPCACKEDSGIEIIKCTSCEGIQHKICYGLLDADEDPVYFLCTDCAHFGSNESKTADLIYTYKGAEKEGLCAMRRALKLCSTLSSVTLFMLQKRLGCKRPLAKTLIERLEFEGFIKKGGIKNNYIVNQKKVMINGFQEYFYKSKDKEIGGSQKEKETLKLDRSSCKPPSETSMNLTGFENTDENSILENVKSLSVSKTKRKCLESIEEKHNITKETDINDSSELFEERPRKRRCTSHSKETINIAKMS